MTPEEFQQRFMPYAVAAGQRTGLDPSLILAQSALETGYGQSAPNNNFFGIKSHGQAGGSNLMTQEFENGQMVSKSQSFRGYDSPEQSFQGYADFILNNPRYGDVMAQDNLTGQIGAMGASGYATDPEYARKLASIAGRFGGEVDASQFGSRGTQDTPQAVGRDTRAALGLLNDGGQTVTPDQQQPRGLLEAIGIQRRDPNAQGETAQPFYQRQTFGDTLARLAPALGRMGVMGLEEPAQAALDARMQRRAQEGQMNKTIEWLASQPGGEQFVKLAEAMGPHAALQAYMQAQQPSAQYRQVRGSEIGYTGESANRLFNVGPDGKVTGIGAGDTNIQVGSGMERDGDYMVIPDPNSPTGTRMELIPNSETDRAQRAAAQADATREDAATTVQEQKESVVGGGIDNLVGMLDSSADRLFNLPEAGIVGSAIGALGINQEAVDFKNELATVQANIAFDRLQQMREASKTGGALGAVSERELDLLMNAYGNLNQSTSPPLLRDNLLAIKRIMTKIENDPVASAAYYGQAGGAPAAGGGDGFSVTGRVD